MFIAMNRFQVRQARRKRSRPSGRPGNPISANMAGFVEFHLLKGPVADDHTLYSSHTTWSTSRIRGLDRSEEFAAPCPRRQQNRRKPLSGPSQVRGF